MNHKNKKHSGRISIKIILLIIIIAISIFGFVVITVVSNSNQTPDDLPKHTMPYVDGDAAVQQVESFYKSLINPSGRVDQKKLVEVYGSKNLEFYEAYYQHGFNPIVCHEKLPVAVDSKLKSTGATAIVESRAIFEDGTESLIQVSVVLNNEGMEIDSVTCPNNKGNLTPAKLTI